MVADSRNGDFVNLVKKRYGWTGYTAIRGRYTKQNKISVEKLCDPISLRRMFAFFDWKVVREK